MAEDNNCPAIPPQKFDKLGVQGGILTDERLPLRGLMGCENIPPPATRESVFAPAYVVTLLTKLTGSFGHLATIK
jgi:hypothetical protein